MEQKPFNIYSHPEFKAQAIEFKDKYNLYKIVGIGDEQYSKRKLKGYSSRTCCFCGLSHPKTTFSSLAHLVPKMIGNNTLYSDFECDRCNKKFSAFENDLAEYLGISRSITGMGNEKRTPGFVGKKIGAKSRSFIGDNILIIAPEDVKREGTKTTISYIKNPFVPSNVYKVLLKCAISLLTDDEVKLNYGLALKYLSGRINIDTGAVIRGYQFSYGTNFPFHVYLFRKRNIEDKAVTHVMCFYFQNHMIALPLPLHKADIGFRDETDILLPPPYFVREEDMASSMPIHFLRDLSSNEKIDDEEEIITIQLDPESLKRTCLYDPATETIEDVDYNPSDQKYFILLKDGVTVNPREFSRFMAEFTKANGG